jgi:hypothetical protein
MQVSTVCVVVRDVHCVVCEDDTFTSGGRLGGGGGGMLGGGVGKLLWWWYRKSKRERERAETGSPTPPLHTTQIVDICRRGGAHPPTMEPGGAEESSKRECEEV